MPAGTVRRHYDDVRTPAIWTAGKFDDGERKPSHMPAWSRVGSRVANGKSQVLDGPYADSKEQLGGYFMIDVPDLDTAISWAARCPAAGHGVIEVRPLWSM